MPPRVCCPHAHAPYCSFAGSSSSQTLVPYRNILNATATPSTGSSTSTILIFYLAPKSKALHAPLKLHVFSATVRAEVCPRASEWCAALSAKAYEGLTPHRRRLRVFVNPHGGKGLAKKCWEKVVQPILAAAACPVTATFTGPLGSPTNAGKLAAALEISQFDALVSISGDGIVHEIINGLANRPDASQALKLPLSVVAAGSGNALAVSLYGPERCRDWALAALTAIKGRAMPLDLMSVSHGSKESPKRTVSFVSTAIGAMGDLDIETEPLRWMGDIRFPIGYVKCVLERRRYECEITVKVVDGDKASIARSHSAAMKAPAVEASASEPGAGAGLPPLRFGSALDPLPEGEGEIHDDFPTTLSPGWHTIRAPHFFAYAGSLPYIAQDVLLFPPARADGLLDIAVVVPASPLTALSAMDGAESGKTFGSKLMRYYKVECFRYTPLHRRGVISVDGEEIGLGALQIEVHKEAGSVLSLEGRFQSREIVL